MSQHHSPPSVCHLSPPLSKCPLSNTLYSQCLALETVSYARSQVLLLLCISYSLTIFLMSHLGKRLFCIYLLTNFTHQDTFQIHPHSSNLHDCIFLQPNSFLLCLYTMILKLSLGHLGSQTLAIVNCIAVNIEVQMPFSNRVMEVLVWMPRIGISGTCRC